MESLRKEDKKPGFKNAHAIEWIEDLDEKIEYTFLIASYANPRANLQITLQNCEELIMYTPLNCTDQQVMLIEMILNLNY
jgi:hypothetical protein